MAFNISSWWHGKRVEAEVMHSGRPVQAHRITNPYHAVSIESGAECVRTAQTFGGQRFLATEAPRLPQSTCSRDACRCRYVHHDDRRAQEDRRLRDVWDPNSQQARAGERRKVRGRRITDQ